jgi:hypothetical protein
MTTGPTVLLTRRQLDAIPEYSLSLPTLLAPGKTWRRNVRWHEGVAAEWWVATVSHVTPDRRGGETAHIDWRPAAVTDESVSAPAPSEWPGVSPLGYY